MQSVGPKRHDSVNRIAGPVVEPVLSCPYTNGAAFTGLTIHQRPGVPIDTARKAMLKVDVAAACQHYIAGGTGFGERGDASMDFYKEADRSDLELVATLLRKTGAFSRIVIHREPHRYVISYKGA